MIRVFPRRTKWTPNDELAFVGDPPLFRPSIQPVFISCCFTWDISEAQRLFKAWNQYYPDVMIGGPARGGKSKGADGHTKLGPSITLHGVTQPAPPKGGS
jgi:hypothetical protein